MAKTKMKTILLLGACMAIHATASAQTPRDLDDLVGARAGQSEGELSRRGYSFVRTQTGDDRKWSYWWNDQTRSCVTIATRDGRYDAITASPPADCGRSADDRRGGTSSYDNRDRYDRDRDDDRDGKRDRGDYRDDGRRGGYADSYDRGGSLTLICYGEGRKPGANYRSGYMWNPRRDRYEYRGFIENGQQQFDSEVQVEIRGGWGRIHLTGKLIPPIRSGGRQGWWDLQDLRVDRGRITAKYRLNGLNSPRVDIDRRSGRIRIDGIEKFRGECDLGDWNDGNRF